MDVCTWRCARRASTGYVILGKVRHFACDEVFFTTVRLVCGKAFGHQETVGCDAQGSMVVKSTPTSTLVVAQTKVLFEILVVALDAPALVGNAHQLMDWGVLR